MSGKRLILVIVALGAFAQRKPPSLANPPKREWPSPSKQSKPEQPDAASQSKKESPAAPAAQAAEPAKPAAPPTEPAKPKGWRPVMAQLQKCVEQLAERDRDILRAPINYMLAKFETANRPMPDIYRESLEAAVELCEKNGSNHEAIVALGDDLRQKAQDCIEHGWYRTVKVQVTTRKQGRPEPGWEVYYQWIPGRNLPNAQKIRFKALSPAEEMLPPGLYAIEARRGAQSLAPVTVAVVSKEPIVCEIEVP